MVNRYEGIGSGCSTRYMCVPSVCETATVNSSWNRPSGCLWGFSVAACFVVTVMLHASILQEFMATWEHTTSKEEWSNTRRV